MKFSVPFISRTEITGTDHFDQYWRSLYFFNIYRLIVGCGLLFAAWELQFTHFNFYNYQLLFQTGLLYVLCSVLSILLARIRSPGFDWQLLFQVGSDIVLFSIMLYASGGLQSGLGVLMLASLAGAGLISRGRLALFFASMAALGLLLQEVYAFLTIDGYIAQYSQAGLMSVAYFAVAWSAHQLAKYTLASEQLAKERAIDLDSMARVNQLIIQDLQEGILIIDKEGNIQQRNYYAEKLLGFNISLDKSKLVNLSDCIPELADQLEKWQSNSETYCNCLRLANTHALVRLRFLPVQADSRSGVVIFMEDMGRVQAQLQQLKLAAVGRLTANIAHEIRNPLSAINHAAELLEEEQIENKVNSRLIRIICDNTQRLNKIVQDVLRLNRRNAAKMESIDLVEFVHKFLTEFCQIEKINSDLFEFVAIEQYAVRFDRDHLNQVLWNLCQNAKRHCRQQAGSVKIVITKATTDNSICLDVIDDGCGIPLPQIKQIFEPFFTTAVGGTGLGLYITRELCENNHAAIDYIEGGFGAHFRIICQNGH